MYIHKHTQIHIYIYTYTYTIYVHTYTHTIIFRQENELKNLKTQSIKDKKNLKSKYTTHQDYQKTFNAANHDQSKPKSTYTELDLEPNHKSNKTPTYHESL